MRIALIEALVLHGPLTATQASAHVHESPTTCSFHLRQLGKYGYVEETSGGKGRARPWRITSIGFQTAEDLADPAAAVAAREILRLLQARQQSRLSAWHRSESSYSAEWRKSAGTDNFLLYVTAEELEALKSELFEALFTRFRDRLTDAALRPDTALPVEVIVQAYPIAHA